MRLRTGALAFLAALLGTTAVLLVAHLIMKVETSAMRFMLIGAIVVAVAVPLEREIFQRSLRRFQWIPTWSGKRFFLMSPSSDQFSIEDIAQALAHICRFNGHCEVPYTVAQHLVLASEIADPSIAREALCHDFAEAYLGDVVTPLKRCLPSYRALEHRVEKALGSWLGIDLLAPPPGVKDVDRLLYLLEASSFSRFKDGEERIPADIRARHLPLRVWSHEEARTRLLARFTELFPEHAVRKT